MMQTPPLLSGIIAIPVTPFHIDGTLDEDSLRRSVRFTLDCGAHGLLGPVNASEWYTLSDDERRRVAEIILNETNGAVPVIVGVTAQNTQLAVKLAQHAQQNGATAVSAMPPHITHPDEEGCYAYYTAIARAVAIPVIIQNYNLPLGTPMSPSLIVRLIRDVPTINYVKEETLPEPLKISQLLSCANSPEGTTGLRGVFGGQGGLYLLEELRRGASGNMPACHVTDALVAIWNAWVAGDHQRAEAMHHQLLPLLSFERCYNGTPVYKEILRRRGIIRTTTMRASAPALDQHALSELDRILAGIDDLLTFRSGS